METYYIYGITKDDGRASDPDAAIDKYYYWRKDASGEWKQFYGYRQNVVDRVKSREVTAWTYPNGHKGAPCTVKVSPNGVEYLKTIPDGNPENNISALPEM